MKVLVKATKATHLKKIAALRNSPKADNQYSKYPVHETEFWSSLIADAKNPKLARKVLDEIGEIENEPCIENERVFRAVQMVKNTAKLTLVELQ